jgi:hypothetical protein
MLSAVPEDAEMVEPSPSGLGGAVAGVRADKPFTHPSVADMEGVQDGLHMPWTLGVVESAFETYFKQIMEQCISRGAPCLSMLRSGSKHC